MYTFTISGAYGIEEAVMGGGVLLTIVSIVVIPVIMGAPIVLVVAELAAAVPSNAGFLMWIKLSFHRCVYLSMAIMSLIYIAVDNALYPTMFSEYLCTSIHCSDTGEKFLRLGMLLFTYSLNMLGVEAVGVASVVLTVLTVSPFVLMYLLQQLRTGFYVNWPAVAYIPASVDWTRFISTASWCLSGLEQAGTVVEEVEDPQRTIIGSLIPLIGLAVITYVPPIIAGASVSREPLDMSKWKTGYWAEVSYQVGGNALKLFTVVGGVLSAFGLTLSALCTTTCIISGMALTEAFPGKVGVWLSRRNKRFGTYHWTLTFNTVLTGLFSTVLGFGSLVLVDQCLYGIRVVVILISFYRFRQLYPYLPRPFRIPFDGWRLHLMMGVALASSVALTIVSLLQEKLTVILCAAVVGASFLVSFLYCRFVHRHDFAGRIVTFVTIPSSRHSNGGGDTDAAATRRALSEAPASTGE
ncbi:putative amino acid permease/transporter [Leishmania major strain Friedlin]|uniref:Putative amino acid permease/transporter n=1 Tax=Leishmania major TaxID=5664 RepID=Q4QH28_LEIMA|nr:putative amino acid permease/transporter [Leishmania major strain Friedlin]CAG9570175.1 amino_acid_permease/transporter_-_putative [Leishmania major strain Friedlin]CAJ02615.1 putative amino acid permease/transporter [Leishmania major strain Friedlin]|eukprot:XP_001681520.1 putative amino acid permease/transporter [Leishmania major strain Friedlin]